MNVAGILLVALLAASPPETVAPLLRAHSHNDYEHGRPLLDALDRGFCSVEADIFLVDGKLLVGHNRKDLRAERTLESLYLDPLQKRIRQNGGRVHQNGPPTVTLLIDFKTAAAPTYAELRKVLARYADILTTVENGRATRRAVSVILSGKEPREQLAADSPRRAGLDGRLTDLDSKTPADLMPLISDSWGRVFSWRGEGPMPAEQQEKLQAIVAKAHAADRRVRFWATPDKPAVWRELNAAGVDLISVDDLDGLKKFLLDQR